MSPMVSRRRFITTALAAVAGGPVFANAPDVSLRPVARRAGFDGGPSLEALLAGAGLSGTVACAVADVKTAVPLESAGGDKSLPPASVAKAVTALYALDRLGATYRFRTQLIAEGSVVGGVLQGDLILSGGGDPTLNTDDLAQLAKSLKAAGVREVRGAFKVWDGALPNINSIDPGQPDHVGYSPAIAGIALNFNRVHFEWKRGANGWGVSMDARTKSYRPEVSMARMKIAQRALPVYTYADRGGRDQWTVADQALGKGGSRWLPVRKPGAYAGDVFRTMARANGIVLKEAKLAGREPKGRVLAEHASAPLDLLLKGMLKYSNNLMAEMIGLTATKAQGGKVGSLSQSAAEMSRWAKARYGVQASRFEDHSGLGEKSRMSPNDLVRVLIGAQRQGALKPLLKTFPMRDAKGRVLKGHPIKVQAKTGTLNFVSGLGGFMVNGDGRELAFAIFSADTAARARISRAERERPKGGRSWNRRAKVLQQQLIERWARVYRV